MHRIKDPYPIEKRSIAEQVYDHIKAMILSGELAAGASIPEEQISQKFGVSRTPVREALKKLEQYGLIMIKPRSFAKVVSLDEDDFKIITDLREALECLSVKLLASKMTNETKDILESIINECEKLLESKDHARIFECDSRLHLEMAKCTGNTYLHDILGKLDAKIQLLRIKRCNSDDMIRHDITAHRLIMDAVYRMDISEAQNLMSAHIKGDMK